jgi:phage repressor protein C with HTH and peptisase S24 domain
VLQGGTMLTHDEILTELIRQVDAKIIRQTDIAVALNIAPPRIVEMRAGKRRIQPNEMPILASLLGLTTKTKKNTTPLTGKHEVKILGKVAVGIWVEQTFIEKDEAETIDYDRMPGDPSAENLFAVIPEGDSMNLVFPTGSILICRHLYSGFADVRSGDYVIVERENHDLREMTCKRLEVADDGDYLLCSESTNPRFKEPMRVPRSYEDEHVDVGINVLGRVVRVVIDFDRNRRLSPN